mmetsp:Transcript_22743/g.53968  ORF Transcript_22743/g.53968 Transcript_22743/m.53968 type:complete len:295 (+) Transcript_22743:1313-2197(+)
MLRRLQGLQPRRDRAGRGVASSGVRHGVLRNGRRQLLPAPDGADGDGRRPCERHAQCGPARPSLHRRGMRGHVRLLVSGWDALRDGRADRDGRSDRCAPRSARPPASADARAGLGGDLRQGDDWTVLPDRDGGHEARRARRSVDRGDARRDVRPGRLLCQVPWHLGRPSRRPPPNQRDGLPVRELRRRVLRLAAPAGGPRRGGPARGHDPRAAPRPHVRRVHHAAGRQRRNGSARPPFLPDARRRVRPPRRARGEPAGKHRAAHVPAQRRRVLPARRGPRRCFGRRRRGGLSAL